MLKISRTFCRYSSLLSCYSFYVDDSQEDCITKINNDFYKHVGSIISDVLNLYQFTNVMLEVLKCKDVDINSSNIDSSEFKIFQSDVYNDVLKTYNIFINSDFEVDNSLQRTFNRYFKTSYSLKELILLLLNDEQILALLKIDIKMYPKCVNSIIEQIIDNFGSEFLEYILNIDVNLRTSNDFCQEILDTFVANRSEIKNYIETYSDKWEENRVHSVEKIIIGLAVSEYKLYKTPIQVLINEYINISKVFCGSKSGIFINGLLDPIIKSLS